MEAETQVVVIGEPAPELESRWASCIFCDNAICVYAPDTADGILAAESIMEDDYGWLFADGTWLCPVCQ